MLRYLSIAVATVTIACGTVWSEDEPKAKQLRRWVQYYKEVAKEYDIRLNSVPDEPLTVSSEPILVYSNPTIGLDTHGALFVWTRKGRAEVIGAIWSKRISSSVESRKNVNHEFHSLAAGPLVAAGPDNVKWTPESPGIELKLVPDAPEPATSRPRRLAQMREISRQFSGFDLNPKESDAKEDEERRMRTLPAPLYRYTEYSHISDKELMKTDGAVFGLFYDWDPEILLIIEMKPTEAGPRWHYGVAYLDYKPLRLQYHETDVWSKTERNFGSSTSKYCCVIGATTRPMTLE